MEYIIIPNVERALNLGIDLITTLGNNKYAMPQNLRSNEYQRRVKSFYLSKV
jgi:hypothetical protein